MTNNEALIIAGNYDVILEMTGMDFEYSLELLEESKKVEDVKSKLDDIKDVLQKKLKTLTEKKEKLSSDGGKTSELKKVEADIESENENAQKQWDKLLHETEFTSVFKTIELNKIPTEKEQLDGIVKDGVSVRRSALMFLTRKGLIKK